MKQAYLPGNILLGCVMNLIRAAVLNLLTPRSTEEGSLEEEAGGR
jgi:hypothetical protein